MGRRGPRIDALADAVAAALPANGRVVEIGFDRGVILEAVLARRPDARALGIEIQPGATVADPRVAVRIGDGFDPLAPGEADVALLAGMGGRTIAELLAREPAKTRSLAALVLSPSHLEADIRPALYALGIGIADERLVTERGRFYEVIIARADHPAHEPDPVAAAWGPRLFARRDPLLPAFLADQRRRFRAAFAEGLRSYRAGPKAALGAKLALLDEALAGLREWPAS